MTKIKREHWRKIVHSDYLSGDEIVDKEGNPTEFTVTIENIIQKEVIDPHSGKPKMKGILILKGADKAMILNIRNGVTIAKVLGSIIWADWIGKKIIIYGMPDKVHGRVVRVKQQKVK